MFDQDGYWLSIQFLVNLYRIFQQVITGETANGEGRSEARTFFIDGMKNKRPEKEPGKSEPE